MQRGIAEGAVSRVQSAVDELSSIGLYSELDEKQYDEWRVLGKEAIRLLHRGLPLEEFLRLQETTHFDSFDLYSTLGERVDELSFEEILQIMRTPGFPAGDDAGLFAAVDLLAQSRDPSIVDHFKEFLLDLPWPHDHAATTRLISFFAERNGEEGARALVDALERYPEPSMLRLDLHAGDHVTYAFLGSRDALIPRQASGRRRFVSVDEGGFGRLFDYAVLDVPNALDLDPHHVAGL
jgi:hypothetical protein